MEKILDIAILHMDSLFLLERDHMKTIHRDVVMVYIF